MAENLKTLGANQRVTIFVEGKALSGSYKNITQWSWQPEYYEGEDEYIGKGPVDPWQVPKASSGSFDIEENSGFDVGAIIEAISAAESSGSKPTVRIVEYTDNNDGTTSKASFSGVTLRRKKDNPGKGQKIKHSFTWRGHVPVESIA